MHLKTLVEGQTSTADSVPTHATVSAWFLGPKAENSEFLQSAFGLIVDRVSKGRIEYFKDDKVFIDEEIKNHPDYKAQLAKIEANLKMLSGLLATHSCPSFSPRYAGHQTFDTTLPAILGYVVGLLYNQNNLSPEIGPLTSWLEYIVGQQLCKMVGYAHNDIASEPDLKISVVEPGDRVGWGHITGSGSVANLESMWVARNLKFYALSLKKAMAQSHPLEFVASTFGVRVYELDKATANMRPTNKLLVQCSSWQLLNLTADQVLGLPGRLSSEYGMSAAFVEKVMEKYIVQTLGKDALEAEFKIAPCRYLISATNHYSWPKAAAITGIGSSNLAEISVDERARMNTKDLDEKLRFCLDNHTAVYAVVAIMGSTEHGAVDPLSEVLALREKYQSLGLSFLVHADAAWGGYFATLTIPDPAAQNLCAVPNANTTEFVPALALMEYTKRELGYLRYADSVTVDPHKTGYIPYPAGGLCYRDERLRFLVTWSSPYLNTDKGGIEAMGVYGVEGSKPGAAACATWLSHRVIGLHENGYGRLLGEAMFTSVKMYSQWATMSLRSNSLVVVPFTKIPAEEDGRPKSEIEQQRNYIQKSIVNRDNYELVNDDVAMALVRRMGSDLMINNFSCNFKIDGKTNTDVDEANYLNRRIYERLSIQKVTDDILERPVIIFSTVFSQAKYQDALTGYKERLGLEGDGDLTTLCNISKTPFPTAGNFVKELADGFQRVAEEEIQNCYRRIQVTPDFHTFVLQGTANPFHLVQLPMFNVGNHRQQLIIKVTIPEKDLKAWNEHRKQHPSAVFTIHNVSKTHLSTILEQGGFSGIITNGLPAVYGPEAQSLEAVPGVPTRITILDIVKKRPLNPAHLDKAYPAQMPFYIYGSLAQTHLDHMLLRAPNAQLSAGNITLKLENMDLSIEAHRRLVEDGLRKGLIAVASAKPEFAMQPFTDAHPPTFFAPWADGISVTLYVDDCDRNGPGLVSHLGKPIATATINLGSNVFADWSLLNDDAALKLDENATETQFTRSTTTRPSSRFLIRPPADEFGRKLAIRQGWKDAVESAAMKV
ncbi:pyridoxal phosphate-dependent transferase [Mycena alexandri]|uniref:Pyridoxal phosphate-dependent transferase n=1 Tax=Mycena alexandri TaxID=1745969 RepID=A0AAD6TD12_9AGAR|nr:pyridoxal phosphate-dependent transferase [Mycena alexandri]